MKHALLPVSLHRDFESIRRVDAQGFEYWDAREVMTLFGYVKWQNFQRVLLRAQAACRLTNQAVMHHFLPISEPAKDVRKMHLGKHRKVDYRLSRLACYLIAQNGDPRKSQIAFAQTYFVVQTRAREIQQLMEEDRRLLERQQVKASNKQLFETAQRAGVVDFRGFNTAGYLGLYEMVPAEVRERKGIGKDDLLDRAGSTELAANLFRITQTDAKLKQDEVKDEEEAEIVHHEVGKRVRQTIEQIGGVLPEHLPPEEHIKQIVRRKVGVLSKRRDQKRLPRGKRAH